MEYLGYHTGYVNTNPSRLECIKVLFESGCNPQDAVFEINNGRVEGCQSFVLDQVSVDTACLCNPKVKLDFSCIISFGAEAAGSCNHKEVGVDLVFKLMRICGCTAECVQSWNYLKAFCVEGNPIREMETKISDSFSVSCCDTPSARCCKYCMVVEGRDFDGRFKHLCVTNPNLTALIQGTLGR